MYSHDFFVNGRQRPFVLNTHASKNLCRTHPSSFLGLTLLSLSSCRRAIPFLNSTISAKQTFCFIHVSSKSSETSHSFEGVGSTKKEAKRCASKYAYDHLIHIYGKEVVDTGTVRDAVASTLTAEKLRKEPVLRCYLYMVTQLTDGWIPISFLLETKTMKTWMNKQRTSETNGSVDIRTQTEEQLKSIASDEAFVVSDDGLLLQSREPLPFPDDMELHAHPTSPEKTSWDAVLLPADTRYTPAAVRLDSRKQYMENVIELLQTEIRYLALVPLARGRTLCLPSFLNAKPEAAVDIARTDVFGGDVSCCITDSHELKPPTLWSNHLPKAAQNLRASWICGRSVYGDALLTLARPSRQHNEMPTAMTWRDYSVTDLWYGVYAVSPRMLYIADLSMPFLGKLPTRFENASKWRGRPPYHILGMYLNLTGRSLNELQKTESDGRETQHLGIVGTDLVVSETDQSAERARQNAALMLMHQIQAIDSELWSTSLHGKLNFEPQEMDIVVVTLDAGHKNRPIVVQGCKTKIQYRLFAWSTTMQNWFLVEWSNGYILDVCDASMLNAAVTGLHVNGCVKIEFRMEFGNLIAHDPAHPFCLFIRVLSVIGCPNQIRLFEPPLSQQRYAAVAQQLMSHECHRIVDIGCGEGRFLESLISEQYIHLQRLYGVDISTSALNRARSRMSPLDTRGDLAVTLFCGNILDGSVVEWKKNVDAAVMIEVIEHLDPGPLSLVGETVLGIIRPRVFIATTPNWEYNRLLYHMDGIPVTSVMGRDGTPLRCSDHRFEWTRDEFQNWATNLAEMYAYDVTFHGIGEMLWENEAREELGLMGHDLGQCSQMAVFTAKQPISSCAEAFSATPCKQAKAMWTTFEYSDIEMRRTI